MSNSNVNENCEEGSFWKTFYTYFSLYQCLSLEGESGPLKVYYGINKLFGANEFFKLQNVPRFLKDKLNFENCFSTFQLFKWIQGIKKRPGNIVTNDSRDRSSFMFCIICVNTWTDILVIKIFLISGNLCDWRCFSL